MRLRTATTAVLLAGLALSTQAHDGPHDDGEAFVHVNDLAITGGAGTVDVSGSLEFGGGTFLAFEDAAGDSRAPGQGMDLLGGTIGQLDDGTIEFRVQIGDLPLGDVQPGALYNWNLGVSGADAQRLFAWRNNGLNGSPNEWYFSVVTFSDGFLESGVAGEFTGSELVWYVNPAQISGRPGAQITAGDGPITASQGGGGALQLTNIVDYDTADWSADSFAIGGGVELVLTGPGGTFDLQPKSRRGEFVGQFTDLAPGTYTLEVISPYADIEYYETFEVTVS